MSPNSLRGVISSPGTVSGDTIDLAALMTPCTITLAHGAIEVTQDSLYLVGASADRLAIDGDLNSSVFYHFGAGTLGIAGVTIKDGLYTNGVAPKGGCIYSRGSVALFDSVVTSCTLESVAAAYPALGAGVYVRDNLTLVRSTITDSHGLASNTGHSAGGAAFAYGHVFARDSTISASSAIEGGGIVAFGSVSIERSTISGNTAESIGALKASGATAQSLSITNSTISGNTASAYGGIWSNEPVLLANSTIAFNHSLAGTPWGDGLFSSGAPLTLRSSIIAGNAGPYSASDLGASQAVAVSGAGNLIMSSTFALPPGVAIASDPELEPLADNGGPTRTHALKPTSPAIDAGVAGGLAVDQRGMLRVSGASADIGSFERQPSDPIRRGLRRAQ